MQAIPPPKSTRDAKYAWHLLKNYGDNIFIDTEGLSVDMVRDAAHKHAKSRGFKVATRQEKGGVRIYHAGERS